MSHKDFLGYSNKLLYKMILTTTTLCDQIIKIIKKDVAKENSYQNEKDLIWQAGKSEKKGSQSMSISGAKTCNV